jgi:hypothetical protein
VTEAPVAAGSLVFDAADRLLAELLDGLDATPDGGFALHRSVDSAPVGEVRVWRAEDLRCLVEVRLAEPSRAIAATMLHVFADPASRIPHLVSDLALLGPRVAVGADLLPRIDPVAAPEWAEEVYPSLDAARRSFAALPGVTDLPAATARWRWLCSPWLTGGTVGIDQVDAAESLLRAYLRQWLALQRTPPAGAGDPVRDRSHLSALFTGATDEVWDVLDGLIGRPAGDRLRDLLVAG